MKRIIRAEELSRLRVLANLVEQSRNFRAFNSVIIRAASCDGAQHLRPRGVK